MENRNCCYKYIVYFSKGSTIVFETDYNDVDYIRMIDDTKKYGSLTLYTYELAWKNLEKEHIIIDATFYERISKKECCY